MAAGPTFGAVAVPFGRYFRVGREAATAPGRSAAARCKTSAMATPRAISFAPSPDGKQMIGHTGQSSTQVVIMTDPPESYAIIPLGESDHKESGHWDDQAEKLFSKGKALAHLLHAARRADEARDVQEGPCIRLMSVNPNEREVLPACSADPRRQSPAAVKAGPEKSHSRTTRRSIQAWHRTMSRRGRRCFRAVRGVADLGGILSRRSSSSA